MKFLFGLLLCTAIAFTAPGQAFQFQQTGTIIVKTTAQSPAHWYLEIENLCGVDTMLRWKADLSGIPAGWTITFDDQNNFNPNLQHGDSADFILFDSLPFPQKLIIGAITNNIPATASAFFDVWNPADTAAPVLLEYMFVITPVTGIEKMEALPTVNLQDGTLLLNGHRTRSYQIFALNGRLVLNGRATERIDVQHLTAGVYFLHLDAVQPKVFRFFILP